MTDTPERTPITDYQMNALMAGINPGRVASLKGLSYVEAYDIKATLIRMFGFGGFSSELIESEILRAEQQPQASNPNKMNWVTTAKAVVRLTIHQTGAIYTEAAIAGSKQPDFTESVDMAMKSAESDALKRAAIFLGDQFGLSLYNNGSTAPLVRVCLAPGAIWPLSTRQQVEAQQAAQQMNAIVEGARPAEQAPQGPPPGSSLTPEQHANAQALVERGLRMKAEQQQDPVEFAQAAQEAAAAPGVPVALDPSLDEGFEEQHTDIEGQERVLEQQ